MGYEKKKACVACKEMIHIQASVCPHCQTQQKKLLRKKILDGIRQLSTLTLVFSLVFAVIEFSRFVDSWLAKSEYAERLAKSASLIVEAGDLESAWDILMEARAINPSSQEIAKLQIQLAMQRVRYDRYESTNEKVKQLKEVIFSLYRGLGLSSEVDADVLAHIAWTYHVLQNMESVNKSIDIKPFFEKAFILNNNSVYANTYMGYLYLRQAEKVVDEHNLSEQELVAQSLRYFNRALATNIDTEYVRMMQFTALYSQNNQFSNAEYIQLALEQIKQNSPFSIQHKTMIVKHIEGIFYSAIEKEIKDNSEFLQYVFLSLTQNDKNLIVDLLKSIEQERKYSDLFFARENEAKGNGQMALEGYITAYEAVKNTTFGLGFVITKMIKRICDTQQRDILLSCDKFFNEIVKPKHLH